ncbi:MULTISPECIES: GNAT family N-acetyltransferase [Actinosynnema]|uniref:GNAT family N-acetyltransferase n=1 Tax=Actinosynnema TaxID=40566 RepID=UPI0020A457A2|nr:GNAT family N-acetyltransferase [Actinosynnema pretiosum]MCP2098848.1 phosphinothricin acetyltransferase [Actinosynnema pretiosum]
MTTSAVTIRPSTAADVAVVAAVYAHYVEHGVATFDEVAPSEEDWAGKRADITGRGLPFLVAEVDGVVSGFAYAAPWRWKRAYRHTAEDTIYLAPGATGHGVGKALLGAVVEAAREAGVRQLIAVIADSGDGASAALHRRFGFGEAGVLRAVGFKHGRWIDTALWQLSL